MNIASWLQAVTWFEKDGDYAVFADPLAAEGIDRTTVDRLTRASFHERTQMVSESRDELRAFRKELPETLTGIGALFRPYLHERMRWAERGELHEHQFQLARTYLRHRDYLRAAVYGLEAYVTRVTLQLGLDQRSYRERKAAVEDRSGEIIHPREYEQLKHLRNSLAHGTRESAWVETTLSDEGTLTAELERLIARLSS